jgi:hypothetical protein
MVIPDDKLVAVIWNDIGFPIPVYIKTNRAS